MENIRAAAARAIIRASSEGAWLESMTFWSELQLAYYAFRLARPRTFAGRVKRIELCRKALRVATESGIPPQSIAVLHLDLAECLAVDSSDEVSLAEAIDHFRAALPLIGDRDDEKRRTVRLEIALLEAQRASLAEASEIPNRVRFALNVLLEAVGAGGCGEAYDACLQWLLVLPRLLFESEARQAQRDVAVTEAQRAEVRRVLPEYMIVAAFDSRICAVARGSDTLDEGRDRRRSDGELAFCTH